MSHELQNQSLVASHKKQSLSPAEQTPTRKLIQRTNMIAKRDIEKYTFVPGFVIGAIGVLIVLLVETKWIQVLGFIVPWLIALGFVYGRGMFRAYKEIDTEKEQDINTLENEWPKRVREIKKLTQYIQECRFLESQCDQYGELPDKLKRDEGGLEDKASSYFDGELQTYLIKTRSDAARINAMQNAMEIAMTKLERPLPLISRK